MATITTGSSAVQTPAVFTSGVRGLQEKSQLPEIKVYGGPKDAQLATEAISNNQAHKPTRLVESFFGEVADKSTGGYIFFESWHVVPRKFDLGNLLSAQQIPIYVYNAHRRESKTWSSFTAPATAGVSLGSAPGLPAVAREQNEFTMTLDVSTVGDAFVDDDLTFSFLGESDILVPIVIQRIVLFGLIPELPFEEFLEFVTNVYESVAGNVQTESVRSIARQFWGYDYLIEEGEEMQILEDLIFDFQPRVFGIPIWFDEAEITADVTAGDITINVEETAYRDFYVGGLVAVYTSQATFDVLTIASFTATTITLTAPTVNSYTAGTSSVYPLATCSTKSNIRGGRFPVGLQRLSIEWERTNNDNDYADLSAYSSYNSKLLLDNGNSMPGDTVPHFFLRDFTTIDNETGTRYQDSEWPNSKRGHTFTHRAQGRQAIWEMRQMIHAIRGRAIPFYVPRDGQDFTAVADLLNAAFTIDIRADGYNTFVRQRSPKDRIRIEFVDGSAPLLRKITTSESVSSSVERLTVDVAWPSTITPAEISKISYVEHVRFDTDRLRISYDQSGNVARLTAPVITDFE